MKSTIHFLLQIPIPEIKNYEDIGLKSFLIFVILMLGFALYKLYMSKEKRVDEHKDDLKFFDSERAKTNKELLQSLNKIALNIEENRLNDTETKRLLDKAILTLESIKNKIDG